MDLFYYYKYCIRKAKGEQSVVSVQKKNWRNKIDEQYKQDGPQLRNSQRENKSFKRINFLLSLLTAKLWFSLSADVQENHQATVIILKYFLDFANN